ncbi:MAG: arylamine N-acetyltransferase [Candidatus Eremiobacteraeota bacterium]|nr:arylamine N-acetyltransferase [Candidatus Eremiobacteraeota bacterium]
MIQAYLERVGLTRVPDLGGLMRAHLQHIPFEALSALSGEPILLDDQSLFQKLVHNKRGGYCFEQNTLFQRVLEELGYDLVPLQARMRRGAKELRPNTHKMLRVRLHDQDWLVDVGVGGEGPYQPIPWGSTQEFQPGIKHRMVSQDDLWVVQNQTDGGEWIDLYATDNRPAEHIDYVMANWFTSTHPTSIFVTHLLTGLHHDGGYKILFDNHLRKRHDGVTTVTEVEPIAALKEHFDLIPPEGFHYATPAPRDLF